MTHPSLKKTIHHALEANDLNAVVSLVKKNRKALSLLVRLAYDKEALVGWRAIKAVGLAASISLGLILKEELWGGFLKLGATSISTARNV